MNSTGGGRARCLRVEDVNCQVLAVEVPEELGAFGDAGSKPRAPSLASGGKSLAGDKSSQNFYSVFMAALHKT
jgi:hypothetical protein